MIKLSGRLICHNLDEARIVQRFLPEHISLTRNESGCIAFDVAVTADPLVWSVEELFTDENTFTAHQERIKTSQWGTETRFILREYEITEIV
ncbi:putative quinol monooxygenase [Yersinia massiliensis]|uniref:putative quinol monooxygenase n=1 Tax=Yersinia massiliensis TaxID=419257 RepID=UPI0011A40CC8|nr:antibiotic biosynthesis monooxygenase [Yersinia massiliensis]